MEATILNTQSLPLPIREKIHTPRVSVYGHGDGIILLPVVEQKTVPKVTRDELDEMLKGSVTESLLGAIPHPPITIQEIREERLARKYGHSD